MPMMQGGDDPTEIEEFTTGDYLETLGIYDFVLDKTFDRDKGPNPISSESQIAEIAKLASIMSFKGTDTIDLVSSPRVIVHSGFVEKKSRHSMKQKRKLLLLNDVLLVTKSSGSEGYLYKSSEKCVIHQILNLDSISLVSLPASDPRDFGIISSTGRIFHFIADSEGDKRIWLEELKNSIFAIMASKPFRLPGWHLKVVTNSLWAAAYLGDLDGVRRYINEHRHDPPDDEGVGYINLPDESGMAPLHWAAFCGHTDVVTELLNEGCDADVFNIGLNTPLMIAASRGYYDVFNVLVSFKADINVRNLKDRDALWMAVLYGYKCRALKYIIDSLKSKQVDLDAQDSYGCSALHECAARNLTWPILLLVDAGADVNSRHGRNGLTPLQMACSIPDPDKETVRAFLDKGAHPNWKDSSGRTAFTMAICTQANHFRTQPTQFAVISGSSTPELVDERTHFAEFTFPVLLEIVKKGGRYMEEDIAHLRSASARASLDASRLQWMETTQPETFVAYLRDGNKNLYIDERHWVPDRSRNNCMLCLSVFSFRTRHHCRACGSLCCGLCTSKRLHLVAPSEAAGSDSPRSQTGNMKTSSKKRKEGDQERVCDGCFNRCRYDLADAENKQREHDKLAKLLESSVKISNGGGSSPGGTAGAATANPAAQKQSLLSGATGKASVTAGASSSTAATAAVLGDAMVALNERGERLKDSAERAEQMNQAANEFLKMTKLLCEQQKRKRDFWS